MHLIFAIYFEFAKIAKIRCTRIYGVLQYLWNVRVKDILEDKLGKKQEYPYRGHSREISKSMFAVQENIMNESISAVLWLNTFVSFKILRKKMCFVKVRQICVWKCAHVYVRMCEEFSLAFYLQCTLELGIWKLM